MPGIAVNIGGRTVYVIDLTLTVGTETPVFPGDPDIAREVVSRIEDTGIEHYLHRLGDHVFVPHADAPNHQNPELKALGVEAYGPEYEFNEAVVIDLADADEAQEVDSIRMLRTVDVAHLEPHADALRAMSAVVVRTGAELWRLSGRPFPPEAIPGFTAEAGAFLAGFENLRVVGTDSLTVDIFDPLLPRHAVHQALKEKLIVESLVHLHEIPEASRKRFLLQTALVKIHGATGCPVVARAWLT